MAYSRRRGTAVNRYMRQSRRSLAAAVEAGELAPVYGLPTQSSLVPAEDLADPRLPDLLHPTPSASIDRAAARRALEFAFTAGDSAGVASGALATAALAESEWEPESFADEIFLRELVDGVLRFQVGGKPAPLDRAHLQRLLTRPPRDRETLAFRQAILRELRDDDVLRAALTKVYEKLVAILALFDESSGQSRYDLPRWRLDLLGALRAFFASLQGPFEHARSGLSRLHTFGALVCQSEGFAELCGLLEFEGDMAQVDLHLCIGADGGVRRLDVMRVAEQRTAPFYRGPVARFFARLGAFLRGYRLGNLELVERWFEHVYLGVLDFLPAVLQLRGDLEFYLTACHLEARARAAGLSVCVPDVHETAPEGPRTLEGLFNPLLLLQHDAPVPCSLSVDSFHRTCILTGPNSGGKTRLLQALALTQTLGQAGFFVPARRAELRRAPGMFVSLGQEGSADQEEGRLGTELLRIRRLFERARPGALVILDELCSGTNPSEGEEIFHLVVGLLRELEPEVFITTHFLQFAQQLADRADELSLCFLQVELDEGRVPTYQFVPGVARTSLARQTAARLGVSREELLALIRRHHSGVRRGS
ncbi:MAG: hypothetical protein PVI30_03180 [Myxococcales bacterium]|jgi:DNA mismatch repair protein MutS2